MALLHSNFQSGTTTDAPLTSVATTINSASFAALPVVSGDTMFLVLDPEGSAGTPEVVTVTAHTSTSTTVTVTRGSESTSAREHLSGTVWRHSLVSSEIDSYRDFQNAGSVDTTNLAADAVDGTKIADDSVDSEHYVDGSIDTAHIADGQVTAAKLAGAVLGAWTTFTPTWSNLAVGNGTYSHNRYRYIPGGMRIQVRFEWGTTTSASGAVSFTIPDSATTGSGDSLGVFHYKDAGADGTGHVYAGTGGTNVALYGGGNDVTATNPHTWATGDDMIIDVTVDLD